MESISQAKQRSAYKGRREVTVSHRRCCLACRFHHGAISVPTPNIPSSFPKAPKLCIALRKASRLGNMVSVSHAAVMEVEECQNISSPLQIEDFSAESSEESIDSIIKVSRGLFLVFESLIITISPILSCCTDDSALNLAECFLVAIMV